LQALGAACELVSGAALRAAEPALGPRVVAARLAEGGNVEVRRLVRALELANLKHGVRIENGVQVTGILRRGDAVAGVRTQAGARPVLHHRARPDRHRPGPEQRPAAGVPDRGLRAGDPARPVRPAALRAPRRLTARPGGRRMDGRVAPKLPGPGLTPRRGAAG